ncbi:MAG: TraB/GumN family protein [Helicobacteraceae bacterium]|jgi:uncharacterized protein YbaP (TraB family)|nr:TraB/GumN family protein [Helicobacteraceae bacterium]
MNRFFYLLFALLTLFLPQGAIAENDAQKPAALYPFYLAQKGDIKVYILGSMHVGTEEDALNDKIIDALKGSSKLIFEIALDDLAEQTNAFAKYICKEPCLQKQLGKRLYKEIKERYPELYIFFPIYTDTIPAWLAVTTIVLIDYAKLGFSQNRGTEILLMKKRGKIKIFGLESMEEQMAMMASISMKAQRESLNDYLNMDKAEIEAYINDLYSLFLEGDADRLFEWYMQASNLYAASKESIDESNQKMIFDRNRLFVDRLKLHLDSHAPVFLSIGALHLGGDKGVLALLREEGYAISRP